MDKKDRTVMEVLQDITFLWFTSYVSCRNQEYDDHKPCVQEEIKKVPINS